MRVLGINAVLPAQLGATIDGDPSPSSVVADDRRDATSALDIPATTAPLVVVRTNGRGPAAARDAGCRINGFDQRFPGAFREDADLGLRTARAGYAVVWGERVTTHPLASPGSWRSGLKDQAGKCRQCLASRETWAPLALADRYVTRTYRPSPDHHRRRDCGNCGYVFQPPRGTACPRQLDPRRGGGGLCVDRVDGVRHQPKTLRGE